jgi:hypothetical protein
VEARPHQSQLSLRRSTRGYSSRTIAEENRLKMEGAHTMTLHDTEEFDHDLRGRTDESLALSTPLSVDNVILQRMCSDE